MLAQNFKAADELGITEEQIEALIKTLVMLETGKLIHNTHESIRQYTRNEEDAPFTGHFNMACWRYATPCGTAGCIGGTAEMIVGRGVFDYYDDQEGGDALDRLFSPRGMKDWAKITPAQSAIALRSYLTTGDARWDLALAS
jgi:hypothetical protein